MNSPRIQSRTMLYTLVGLHLVAGWVLGIVVYADTDFLGLSSFRYFLMFSGLFFAQIALIGFWAAFGHAPAFSRMIWGTLTLLYWIGFFLKVTPGGDQFFLFLLPSYAASIILLLGAMRKWVARLDCPLQPETARIRFEIRHLFLLTFAICFMLALVKWFPAGSLEEVGETIGFIMFMLPPASIGLGAVWVMLRKNSIWLPTILLLSYAVAAGWFIDSRASNMPSLHMMTSLFAMDATVLLVSLGIVRCCGYRLVPLRQQNEKLPVVGAANEEPTNAASKP